MTVPQQNSILPDANIWVSQTLHSWISLIASETKGYWHFYYTEDILAEALHGRRRRCPLTNSKQIEDMRDRLIKASTGLQRISNFSIDESVEYPDKFDAHVHSAAVHAKISYLVTNNSKDFLTLYENIDDCPYEVYTADEFLLLVAECNPKVIDKVIKLQHDYWSKKGEHFSLPKQLKSAGCPNFADYVCRRLQRIL